MTTFLSKQFLEGYRSFLVQASTWLNSGFAFTRIYRDSPHFSLNFSIIYSLKIIAVIEYIISIDKIYLPLSILSEKLCGRNSSTRFHVDVPVDKSRKLRMTRFCKNSVIRNSGATVRHGRDLYELNTVSISTGNFVRISKIPFILT